MKTDGSSGRLSAQGAWRGARGSQNAALAAPGGRVKACTREGTSGSFTSDPSRLSADIRQNAKRAWRNAGERFLKQKKTRIYNPSLQSPNTRSLNFAYNADSVEAVDSKEHHSSYPVALGVMRGTGQCCEKQQAYKHTVCKCGSGYKCLVCRCGKEYPLKAEMWMCTTGTARDYHHSAWRSLDSDSA